MIVIREIKKLTHNVAKENFKKTLKVQSINSKLDEAIDNMDMPEIERELAKLSEGMTIPYEIEDSKTFARRIIKQNKKGHESMRNNIKKIGTVAACLVLTITIDVTAAYATGVSKNFKFYNEKTTVEVRTNQNISEEEAERLAKEAEEEEEDYNSTSTVGKSVMVTEKIFSSIEEVEESIGIEIVLPSDIPVDFIMEKDIIEGRWRGYCYNR